jgi:HEAT repeat protein
VVSVFEKTLKDPSGPVRDATAVALARLGLDEFQGQFVDALRDSDELVRAAAVKALGEIGRVELFQPISTAASDPSHVVREQAMLALTGYADADAGNLVERGARDPDARVRSRALTVLAQRNDRDTSPLLRELLKDATNPEIALKCAAGLARRGDRVDLALAERTLAAKDADMRGLAVDVLRAAESPASTDLLLRVAETDRDGRLRVQAATALVKRLAKGGTR